MPDPIIPSARRFTQILRNLKLYNSKQDAIAQFASINNNSELGVLYDGEPIEARYAVKYVISSGVATEGTVTSLTSVTFNNIEILTTPTLASNYPANTIFLIPSGSGTYDAYTSSNPLSGQDVTQYSHPSDGDVYGIRTLFGVVSKYDDTHLKVVFIDQQASSSGGGGGLPITHADKTINVIDTGTAYDLSANIDNLTIKKDMSTGVMSVNIDSDTLVRNGSTGVISVDPKYTAIFGDNAISISTHQTSGTVDGHTVSLTIKSGEKILKQDGNGLYSSLSLVKYTSKDYDGTTDLPSGVAARYRLKNGDTATASSSNIGDPIDIPTDRNLYSVYLGHVDDTLTSSTNPAVVSGTGDAALCFIYELSDGTYTLAAVNIESYLTESEFSDGLTVSSHIVKANLGDGLTFDSSSPKKIQANLGTGLQLDTSSPKKIELKKSATSEIGGIRVGAVKGTAVSGLSTAVENAITTDTTPTASNMYRRYAVLSDSNGLGYINIPSFGPNVIAQYSTTASAASPLTGVDNLIVLDSNGQLSTLNVWDCGTYYN